MSDVVVFTSPTLDGVMQAPGRPRRGPWCWDRDADSSPTAAQWPRSKLVDSVTATTGVLVATYQPTQPHPGAN